MIEVTDKNQLGNLVLQLGLLDSKDLSQAVSIAQETSLPLGRVLVLSSLLTEGELQATLRCQSLLKQSLVEVKLAQKAMELVKQELADPTSDRVLEVLILASERGGQIVKEILEDLVVTTTKDLKVLDEIETEGLEMRINARAVLVLPWFVLLALTIRGGAFREFYQSGPGVLVVAAGGVLSAIGYAWITRLSRSLDERRVFGGASSGNALARQVR